MFLGRASLSVLHTSIPLFACVSTCVLLQHNIVDSFHLILLSGTNEIPSPHNETPLHRHLRPLFILRPVVPFYVSPPPPPALVAVRKTYEVD